MVFTLHRYIFRELFRVFVLATVALIVILSLGSILRPVQEYGVGPAQVIHLIGYFLPIFLTFVLPMAALFAAALVYGRLASDNELDACKASGISLLTLVYPGLALALMVTIANLILSFHVIPAFIKRAEKSLKADAKQIVFRNIQRKGYYKPADGKYLIYADQANPKNETLGGLLLAEIKENRIGKITTAENAKVHFISHDNFNEVQITAYQTFQMGIEQQEGGFSAELLSLTKELPSMMPDDIKFEKIEKLKKIVQDPMEFYPIEKQVRQVYAQFTAELLAQNIRNKFINEPNDYYRLNCGENFIEFIAGNCIAKQEQKVQLTGEVVIRDATKKVLRILKCTNAIIYIEGDKLAPTLTLEMYNAKWHRPDGMEVLDRRPIIYGLLLPQEVVPENVTSNQQVTEEFKNKAIMQAVKPDNIQLTLEQAATSHLIVIAKELQRQINRLLVKIAAEKHFRLVFGLGCIPLIMIGIGLGIIIKGAHLLTAFGISAIPAAILIVCIMMGKNIAKNPEASLTAGILLIWSGFAFLTLLAGIIYRKLLKN